MNVWSHIKDLSEFKCPVCSHIMTREVGELFSEFESRCNEHVKCFCSV